MGREHVSFTLGDDVLQATIDTPDSPNTEAKTALLIVSGGNEIRSGAHAGQAILAQAIAAKGYIVMRYDRRGIGDSSGDNQGFLSTQDDIGGALACLRTHYPQLKRIVAFGNCDAAAALSLYQQALGFDGLIMTNPWTIDDDSADDNGGDTATDAQDTPSNLPSAAAIRQRYWQKIKDPRALIGLFTGKVDLKKLLTGLKHARNTDIQPSQLAQKMAQSMANINKPTLIILAQQDRTAMDFAALWNSTHFNDARGNAHIYLEKCDSASHSFADKQSYTMLLDHISAYLKA